MDIQNILSFLSDLAANNNREWFADNKTRYEQAKATFEQLGNILIERLGTFDPEVRSLQAKDCIFRIYRDTRFSLDKTPYKKHMGIFVSANGGRKSYRGGYYLHIEPNGRSMVSGGIWCPTPELLKALRQSVYDNTDELLDIINAPDFHSYYPALWNEEKLKTTPRGYPKDFPHAELLKLKHYMVEHFLSDQEVTSPDFLDAAIEGFRLLKPFNDFFNYTVDEVLGYSIRSNK